MNSAEPNIVNENQYILFFFLKKKTDFDKGIFVIERRIRQHIEQTRLIFYFLNFHNPNESKHVRKIDIIENEKRKYSGFGCRSKN